MAIFWICIFNIVNNQFANLQTPPILSIMKSRFDMNKILRKIIVDFTNIFGYIDDRFYITTSD